MTYLAHAGHWATSVLEFAPILAFLVWLVVTQWRERRRAARPERGEAESDGEATGSRPKP